MNQKYGIFRKRKNNLLIAYETTVEIAQVTTIVYCEATEKIDKWLSLWIHEMATNLKKQNKKV